MARIFYHLVTKKYSEIQRKDVLVRSRYEGLENLIEALKYRPHEVVGMFITYGGEIAPDDKIREFRNFLNKELKRE